jgi:hypothetical protein
MPLSGDAKKIVGQFNRTFIKQNRLDALARFCSSNPANQPIFEAYLKII